MLERSGYELGCPVATVTLEMASRSPVIREAAADAYTSWMELLAAVFEHTDNPSEVAVFVLATIEGALLLARAWQTTAPVLACGQRLAALFGA